MRGILINPTQRTITEVDVKRPNESLTDFYRLIGCCIVEIIPLDRGISLVSDEEARLKPVTGAFRFYGSPELVIAGNAIVMGDNGSRFLPLHEDIANLRKILEWVAPQDVPEPRLQIIGIG